MTVLPKLEQNFDATSDSDVILLTTAEDGRATQIHVHSKILSEASPFFKTMFSLPQPLQDCDNDERRPQAPFRKRTLPTVPVPEPAHVLTKVLRLVYGMQQPQIGTLDELTVLLSVAIKYDFVTAVETLRATLVSPEFLADPIAVYAAACRFDLDHEAVIASEGTLNIDLLGDIETHPHPSLRHISAYDYYQLLVLHRRRGLAACTLLNIPANVKCMQCNGSVFTMHMPPKWWEEWVIGAKEELAKRPTSERIFAVDWVFEAARRTGCSKCPESVLDSWQVLMELKAKIDQLPSTILPSS